MSNLEVTMIMQRLEKEDDLYSMEIRNLLSEGGLEGLIGQYRMIRRKLDKMSVENRELQKNVKDYKDKIAELENIINHKLGGWNKHGITYQEILDMEAENQKLKQRIAELESNETENISEIDTSSPLACAESLIEHMTHCEKYMIMPERDVKTFSVEELKEIADYLMVYYEHHRDRDDEPIAF